MLLPTALAAPPVLFASGLARQPAPSMVIPALPAVAVAGAGLVAWNVRRQNKEKDAFFNMEWAEQSGSCSSPGMVDRRKAILFRDHLPSLYVYSRKVHDQHVVGK